MQGMSKKLSGLLLVMLTYTVCNIFMFAINGVCWDDSLIWNADRSLFDFYFGLDACNNRIEYWYYTTILDNFSLQGQLVTFRILAFASGLLSSIAVWFLSKKVMGNNAASLSVALLFAACSVNRTGMMICCLHYAISNMLVLWGMVAIAYDYYKENIWFRSLAALLWLIALLLWRSAVLLIPAVIVTLCCFKVNFRWNRLKSYGDVVVCAVSKYWMVILACVFYAVSFLTFAHPKTFVAEYSTVTAENLLLSPLTATMTSLHILLRYVGLLFEAFSFGDSLLSVCPVLLAVLLYVLFRKTEKSSVRNEDRVIIMAVVFLVFGVWPQMLIKDVIYTVDLHTEASRIASLSPLPICVLLVCLVSHFPVKLEKAAMAFLISASVFYSVSVYLDYEVGQEKNRDIESFFAANPELKGKTVLIKDYASNLNSFPGSYMRPYEYESLSAHVYGQDSAVKVSLNSSTEEIDYALTIDNGELTYGWYRLFAYRFIAPERYDEAVKRLVRFDLQSDEKE